MSSYKMNTSKASKRPSLPLTLGSDIPNAQLHCEDDQSPPPRVINGNRLELSDGTYGDTKEVNRKKRGRREKLSSSGRWSAGNASKRSRQEEKLGSSVPIEIKIMQEDVAGCYVADGSGEVRDKDKDKERNLGNQAFDGFDVVDEEDDRSIEKKCDKPDTDRDCHVSEVKQLKEGQQRKSQNPHSQHRARACDVAARNGRDSDGNCSGLPRYICVPRNTGYLPLGSDGSLSSGSAESICNDTQTIEEQVLQSRHDLASLRVNAMQPAGEMMDDFEDTLCFVERTIKRSICSPLAKEMLKQLNFLTALDEQWKLLLKAAYDTSVAGPPKAEKQVGGSCRVDADEKARVESQAQRRNEKDTRHCEVMKDIENAIRLRPAPVDLEARSRSRVEKARTDVWNY
jgi:hypothetical protein